MSTELSVKNIDQILVKMSADHPGDIIADIMHWCDAHREDFHNLVRTGKEYYLDEVMAGKVYSDTLTDSRE